MKQKMPELELVIKGGLIITDREILKTDLGISNGKIATLGNGLQGIQTIDAGGLYVLPGGVDPHVHLNMPTATTVTSDNWSTGTKAAACGGTTTIIDFIEPEQGQELMSALMQRRSEADGTVWVDYALHMTINNSKPETLAQIPGLSEKGINSYKLYTTYEGMKLSYEEISLVMKSIAASGGICMVHAEDDSIIQSAVSALVKEGKLSSKWFPFSRPPEAEIKAVEECIQLAGESGVILYLVHLSTGKAVEAVINARATGLQVVAESCPQYLLLNQAMITEGDPFTAAALICSPALKSEDENRHLWNAIRANQLQSIGSDHCSFNLYTQKSPVLNDFRYVPGGLPGIELRYPLIHHYAVLKGLLGLTDWVRLCSTQPAQIFGLWPQKGSLAVGSDADIVLFDPEKKVIIDRNLLHEHVDYSPYESLELQGYPVLTLLRGNLVVENGAMKAPGPSGEYLKCSSPTFL
jgi:dihydropyrimidinase